MQNQKKQKQDEKLLSFPLNLLSGLRSQDAKRYQNMHKFFKTAFVELSAHEYFDDPEYRVEWQTNLMYMENLAIPYKGYSFQEVQQAISIALKVLEKNREEVTNA